MKKYLNSDEYVPVIYLPKKIKGKAILKECASDYYDITRIFFRFYNKKKDEFDGFYCDGEDLKLIE